MKIKISRFLAVALGGVAMLAILNVPRSTAFAQGAGYTNWNDLTTNWMPASVSVETWSLAAMSSDGTKLAAVYGGGMCTSTDSGATWTPTTFSSGWSPGAFSADGTKQVAGGGNVFVSSDSGATWTQTSLPNNPGTWGRIASSADGTTFVVGSLVSPGWIYMSTNSGAEWWQVPMGAAWGGIMVSADGATVMAWPAYSNQIFASTNRGAGWYWITLPSYATWTAIAASEDAVKLVACANGSYGSSAGVFISTNSGAGWIQTSAPNMNWSRLVSSADGAILAAATADGGIYVSTNSGTRWIQTAAPSTGWSSIAMSADGTRLVAVNGSGIWTAHVRFIPLVPPTLNIAPAGGQNVIYWPAWASDYVLETTTDVSSTNWTTVTNATPVIAVTVTNTSPEQFFRLRQH